MLMPIKQQDPIQEKPDNDEDIGPQKINISVNISFKFIFLIGNKKNLNS